jgi:hypothetical protein
MRNRIRRAAGLVSGTWQVTVQRWPVQTRGPQIIDSGRRVAGFLLPSGGLEGKIDRLKREADGGGAFWLKAVAHTPIGAAAAIDVARP